MGGEYKPFQSAGLESFGELQVAYIHNSYLFLPLKLGVLGAAIVLSVLLWLTIRSNFLIVEANTSGVVSAVQLAVGATMIHTMALAFIQPQFNAFLATLVISIILAMTEHLRAFVAPVPVSTSKIRYKQKVLMGRSA